MAGGGYPAAYRDASRPLARPTGPLSSPGWTAPRVPGTFPGLNPANQNFPKPSTIGRALPIAGRLLPLIGYGLLLWELWKLWQELAETFAQPQGRTLRGWSKVRSHCSGRDDFIALSGLLPEGYCPGNQAMQPLANVAAHTQVTTAQDNGPHFFGAPWRAAWPVSGYSRPNTSVGDNFLSDVRKGPGYVPQLEPLPLPAVIPQVLPEAAPAPGTPVPDPAPVPHAFAPYLPDVNPVGDPIRGPIVRTQPRPNRRPYRRTRRGPIFIPFPDIEIIGDTPDELPEPSPSDPHPVPAPGGLPLPDAGPRPDTVPGVRVRFQPDAKPEPEPFRHRLAPPVVRTKERKVILTLNGRHAVARGISATTEYCDVVDAIYRALPKHIRDAVERESSSDKATKETPWWFVKRDPAGRGDQNPDRRDVACQNKAAAIGAFFDEVDLNQAFHNLMEEQILDIVIGRLGKAAGEVGRAIGAPVGLGTGPAL